MKIETISKHNLEALTELMLQLWPDCIFKEEFANCERILSSEKEICFLAKDHDKYVAFIQLSIRTEYVEGATSSPVTYIEGIYVNPAFQRLGIGNKLIQIGEQWGIQKGCKQYASDAELINKNSIEFHKKVGFKEVNRTVSFIKNITS